MARPKRQSDARRVAFYLRVSTGEQTTANQRRELEVVAAWSVDRLGRSLQHLVEFLGELHAAGADLYLHQQGLDTSTPLGRAMFQMLGVFAEFERGIIRERVNAGLARAREEGRVGGRPTVPADTEAHLRELLAGGMGMVKAAKTVGVGTSVAQRVRRAMMAEVDRG